MNHILLKDGKAWAVDMPEIPPVSLSIYADMGSMRQYEKDKQRAIDNAVPFKDSDGTWKTMYFAGLFAYQTISEQENKLYPCPDGYRIDIEGEQAILKPVN